MGQRTLNVVMPTTFKDNEAQLRKALEQEHYWTQQTDKKRRPPLLMVKRNDVWELK